MQLTVAYVENLARQAGAILRDGYSKEHQVGYKGVIDLVTEIDHQSEAFLLGEVQRDFPEHHIVAEESGVIEGSDQHTWFIDPLDELCPSRPDVLCFDWVCIERRSNAGRCIRPNAR